MLHFIQPEFLDGLKGEVSRQMPDHLEARGVRLAQHRFQYRRLHIAVVHLDEVRPRPLHLPYGFAAFLGRRCRNRSRPGWLHYVELAARREKSAAPRASHS